MSVSFISLMSALVMVALLGSVLLGWLADLRRVRGATSARQSWGAHENRVRSAYSNGAAGARSGRTGSRAGPPRPGAARRGTGGRGPGRAGGLGARYGTGGANAQAFAERIRRERVERERREANRRRAEGASAQGHAGYAHTQVPTSAETEDARHRRTLEIVGEPTAETVRRHYKRLIASYHPDRVASLGLKLRRLAEEETKAINEAYAYFKKRLGG